MERLQAGSIQMTDARVVRCSRVLGKNLKCAGTDVTSVRGCSRRAYASSRTTCRVCFKSARAAMRGVTYGSLKRTQCRSDMRCADNTLQ